ncbi:MAG: ABC transporter permease [Bryobacteraceae bacterium]
MTWLRRLLGRRRMEDQLDKELRFHLERHAADLIAHGQNPDEARRQARIAFGGPEQVKEQCRDARGTRRIEDLFQDLRYALRTMRQRPGFAAVAVMTLALGTGATSVMFTVVSGVLLKPLAYPEPQRLVSLHEHSEFEWAFSYPNFLDCKRQSRSLAMAAWRFGGGTISEPGEADYIFGRQISADLFSVLGVPLYRGRAFLRDEDRPGGAPVAIISYGLWQSRFGGKPDAIGGRIVFNGKGYIGSRAYTVVGVTPSRFQLSGEADVFTPIGQNTAPTMQNREMHPGIQVIGRLRSGVTLAQAQAEVALIGHRLAKQYPKEDAGQNFGAEPLRQRIVGDVRPILWLLLGSVSLVLLIACVNVASLLLARAVSRERELAMRAALGAGRGRLIRQCLTESAILALAGGALGVILAAVGARPFVTFWPGSLPRAEEIHLDWRVLLFAFSASLLSGLFFGLAPALRAPARELERTLRAGARTVTGSSRRLHSGFVISEISLAVVLLIAAGILGRTLLRVSSLNPGFDPHNVLVTQVALSSDALTSPAGTRAAWQDILDRVRSVPGVRSVAVADIVPMGTDTEEIGYWTTSSPPPANRIPLSIMNLVTPDYLKVMGIKLLQGRFFTGQDRPGGEPVVVIDDVMAQRAFGGRNPIGNRLNLQFLGATRVAGVVGHVRHFGLAADDQASVREQIYIPFVQLPDPFMRLTSGMWLMVRTGVSPLTMVEAVRRSVRSATRDQAIYDVSTMEQIVGASLARQRFLLLLFSIFAGLALLLACIGIYGVLAYLTSQRVPEIGVRMALGANAGDVMRMVFRQSLVMIFIGVAVGIAASLAAGRVLEQLVAGVQPTDPVTYATMISVLAAAALFASFLPARRAARVDPMTALRQE